MDYTKATASNMTGKALSANSKNSNGSNPKKDNAAKPPNPKGKATAPSPNTLNDPDSMFKGGFLADVYIENPVRTDGIGRVVTRFPPEPNGFLHLRHTKAIMINFGFAKFHETVLMSVIAPNKRLWPNAVAAKARPAMRDGKYQPREAVLRMRQNLEDNNPQMWDLTAYRVLDEKHRHHRTGNKWRIYPTYDFTHCLCDSFEGVTHSLCTTEFELSRVSYEWLCDKVAVYKPMQREFGCLRISGTVLSKRKILALIENNHVRDWDDPRLYTLIALRRRGVPPESILGFVNELGVTKAEIPLIPNGLSMIIENIPEDYIEMVELPFSKDPAYGVHTVPFTRTVYIERGDFRESASKDFFRLAPGTSVGLLKVPYPITATGFETDPETGLVTLVHARYEKPNEGTAFKKPKSYIHWVAKCPSKDSPVKATVRVFNPLFKSDDPDAHPEGFLSNINPRSEEIFPNAMIETGIEEIKRTAPWPRPRSGQNDVASATTSPETVRFQGMRVAYFCLDRDSTETNLILNRIVSLKEDAKKA
ncbi:hypothetical protein V502_06147 [Pseudogymnoascus sp. VKM F-4520 (FW-2644)]|nr:hypothetical protein V502_06147 [Pseudogymnoascus sp. VKM F-4520 (FW-2644)]